MSCSSLVSRKCLRCSLSNVASVMFEKLFIVSRDNTYGQNYSLKNNILMSKIAKEKKFIFYIYMAFLILTLPAPILKRSEEKKLT